jgi:hypothetical protein
MDSNNILNDYLDAISSIPLPSEEQTDRFGGYVVNAHSWYKHLTPAPPGDKFMFFLNPNVARVPLYEGQKLIGFKDYEKYDRDTQIMHDIPMLTHKYYESFGYWDYFPRVAEFTIVNREMKCIPIPQQLVEAGTCRLTSWVSSWQPDLYGRCNGKIENPNDEASIRYIEYSDNCKKLNEGIPKTREEQKDLNKNTEIIELKKRINDYKDLECRLQSKKMWQAIFGFLNLVKELREGRI